jgi:hypothetical protein
MRYPVCSGVPLFLHRAGEEGVQAHHGEVPGTDESDAGGEDRAHRFALSTLSCAFFSIYVWKYILLRILRLLCCPCWWCPGSSPTFIKTEDLARMAPEWMNMSIAIFNDPEANKVRYRIVCK